MRVVRVTFLFACASLSGCTDGEGAERPSAEPPPIATTVSARDDEASSPTNTQWGWATRVASQADRVLGLVLTDDGSTVMLSSEGIGWRSDGVALTRYDANGALVYAREIDLRSGPEENAMTLRGDRIEVLDVAIDEGRPALKIASFAVADGRWLEERSWDGEGEFYPHELHAFGDGDTIVAGSARGKLRAGAFEIGAADRESRPFVARFDAEGRTRWLAALGDRKPDDDGGPSNVTATAIASGGVVMTGQCDGRSFGDMRGGGPRLDCSRLRPDGYVAMWSADGELEWLDGMLVDDERTGFVAGVEPLGIAAGRAAGIAVVGRFDATFSAGRGRHRDVLASHGSEDAFVLHYRDDGELEGAWSVGGPGLDRFVDVAIDSAGDAWIAGVVYGEETLTMPLDATPRVTPPWTKGPLPRYGVLVRADLQRRAAATLPGRFVAAQGEFSGPSDGVSPQRVAVSHDRVRVAGSYGGRIELPILDGTVTTLELRDPEGIDDELFLWASARRLPPQ